MPGRGAVVPDDPLPEGSWASSPARRRVMQANTRRDTKPELALRSALHALGLRFRNDTRPLPGLNRRADIVFRPAKVAVFVHGCFWHGCPEHYSAPATNDGYWSAKVARNRERDADTVARLRAEGWLPVVVWEHDDPRAAARRIGARVRRRRESGG